ncbi:hypothetical protein DET49_1454 [Salegentibacter sp. 24]|nr:hypothetical protein DET49_1454 [Salegentibacter sp. 24]
MKNNGPSFLILTTIILVTVTILVFFRIGFPVVFYLTCIGQILMIFSIYKVLTDKYSTKKKFKDWYEDYPKK